MAIWYVYRGINNTMEEIYYGVSRRPRQRVSSSHCEGGTKTLALWQCSTDDIEWSIVAERKTQRGASRLAHAMERKRCPVGYGGYFIHKTGGI